MVAQEEAVGAEAEGGEGQNVVQEANVPLELPRGTGSHGSSSVVIDFAAVDRAQAEEDALLMDKFKQVTYSIPKSLGGSGGRIGEGSGGKGSSRRSKSSGRNSAEERGEGPAVFRQVDEGVEIKPLSTQQLRKEEEKALPAVRLVEEFERLFSEVAAGLSGGAAPGPAMEVLEELYTQVLAGKQVC
uniref:Uncharacterized protein n=1 Tax=Chromera velia CCMP2878 TaxID=1169474 RepID=A0A0G4I940_9ALVE|eukprot:Cvel_12144.t1-p1 / transcript=Cvel_12144.t1 / gene=Cvel_12144 / organism=Chromera_velia_CCMP2878 / gene_product=hypothetical protein / transcript_product=hypothetical protein / location=Cvel_scaffold783:384-2292(+) / protein_length=185 / sequence_SO=supercontig / SO=protein_coding / is_pseudo=false